MESRRIARIRSGRVRAFFNSPGVPDAVVSNTIGAAIGPIVAGFVFIPTIGVEGSFFTIGVLYVVIALLALRNRISLIPIAIAAVTRRSDRNGCLSAQRERQTDSSIARCSSSWACPRRVRRKFYAGF